MSTVNFFMLVGLPGSGKSTKAKELADTYNANIHSSDAIREEINGNESSQENDDKVFSTLHSRIKDDLMRGKSTIYDACNISYKKRMAFLREIKRYDVNCVCYFICTPFDQCIINNTKRNRFVPVGVITNMRKNFYVPQYFEGWNDIVFYDKYTKIKYKTIDELFYDKENGLCGIDQENPHHTLSIGDHCISCYLNVLENMLHGGYDRNICMAALLHDIGKASTKDFRDSKGNECDTAHYYQHHLVSAYDAIPYIISLEQKDRLEILALITFHMFPYFWEKDGNERMRKKYLNLLGEELYEKLMILHEADKAAH